MNSGCERATRKARIIFRPGYDQTNVFEARAMVSLHTPSPQITECTWIWPQYLQPEELNTWLKSEKSLDKNNPIAFWPASSRHPQTTMVGYHRQRADNYSVFTDWTLKICSTDWFLQPWNVPRELNYTEYLIKTFVLWPNISLKQSFSLSLQRQVYV